MPLQVPAAPHVLPAGPLYVYADTVRNRAGGAVRAVACQACSICWPLPCGDTDWSWGDGVMCSPMGWQHWQHWEHLHRHIGRGSAIQKSLQVEDQPDELLCTVRQRKRSQCAQSRGRAAGHREAGGGALWERPILSCFKGTVSSPGALLVVNVG